MFSDLPEAVQIQLLIVFGSIITAVVVTVGTIIVAILNRTRQHAKESSQHAKETRWQVQNDHATNLREDLDSKFASVLASIDTSFAAIRTEITTLHKADSDLRIELIRNRTPKEKSSYD